MERYQLSTDPATGERYLPVTVLGAELKDDPMLNKGTAFPENERDLLHLRGLLPPAVSSMEQQLARALENYQRQPDDLARHVYLMALHDRNETLFYRLLLGHLDEMLPIVYTPTVGLACQRYSHIYRRARGLFVSPADIDRMPEVLRNFPSRGVAAIVATDGEGVLGIGDQGAGGMGISIGKLVLYTVGAGIHPARCLPICIDVGTGNESLRRDPLYLGLRQEKLRGERYFALLDALVEGVRRVFPGALLQWEDFSKQNARTVLDRYRDGICSFNDDIQGTAAVVLAGVLKYCHLVRQPFTDQRFCVFGAGAAGTGIIAALTRTLRDLGFSRNEAHRRVAALDSAGLVVGDRPGLEPYKRDAAWDRSFAAGWKLRRSDRIDLGDVVRNFAPTILIGTSGQAGSFTEEIVREMAGRVERPAILALSNPTDASEVVPADAIRWSQGRAIVATGSPFAPVEHEGRRHEVAQCNNVLCFPGIGLGTMVSGACRVTDGMLHAAGLAVAEQVSASDVAAGRIYPPIRNIRAVSRAVACAVAEAAVRTGAVAAPVGPDRESILRRIDAETWSPDYVPYRPVVSETGKARQPVKNTANLTTGGRREAHRPGAM